MVQKLVSLIMLIILVGCQASGGGAGGGDIIQGHTPVDNKFTLSTTIPANYATGQSISFVLTFPKAVVVSGGTPEISVVIGSTTRLVPMSSSAGSTLTFNYTIVAGDVDNDGISVSPTLNKNGATIKYDTSYDTTSIITVPNLSSIIINPVGGNPPIANNINPAAFNEEASSTITLSYTDANGDLATSCSITSPTKVTVTTPCACAAGVCSVGVTGQLNQTGAAGFQYTVTANSQVSNTATAAFMLNNVPDIPVANNITPPAFNEDTQSIITLSYTDGDADLATACTISSPTNVLVTQACACAAGVCTVGVTGSANYTGAASFNYTVTANAQVSNSATATLSITAINDAPIANNISPAAFNEDIQSIITLSYTDAESDQATSCALSGLSNVTVTQACACAAGVCTVGVTGALNYNGPAGFNYTVTAGSVSNSATATLTINPIDDAPVANNITPPAYNANVQSIITLSYADVESHQATVCAISGETNTTVTQACACAAGVCTVGVTSSSAGAASFNYTVTANTLISNSATATLTVNGSAPVANNITPANFNEDTQSIITLSYTDAESDPATACSISSPTNITVTQACACAASVCTVGVTGTLNYNGSASFGFTVTANSETSNTATATLTISPVDDDPVANNITPPAFNEDTLSVITLSYTDVDSDPATACTVSNNSNVTVTQACACAAGVCTVGVTGTAGYSGAASFDYTVTANSKVSNVATATLTITSVADAPVANNITPPAFDEDVASTITLSYTDEENDLATTCSISSPTNITVSTACSCAAGVCTVGVTGTANFNGAASFTYTVTANGQPSNSASATLTINPVNDAPVASNITPGSFNENTQSIITLSYTDVDSDNALTCSISSETNVTVTQACVCAAGVCTVGVTGTSNYFGPASFNYTVTDSALTSNSALASLTILDVNDPPVANNINPAAFNEDTQSIITLSYTDADSDLATVCNVSSPTNVSVTQACTCAAGVCTVGVTGSLNYNGAASFTYTVTANSQVSNSATATLSITAVSDAPVAANITPAAFNEDTQEVITLSYTDVESDLATTCAISSPTNVSVTQACACAAGVCTVGVTGSLNHNGAASFSYTVTANAQTSNTATATLTITPVNDAPVAADITPPAFNEDTQSVITLSYTDVDTENALSCTISSPTNVTVTQGCACAAGVCTVGVTGALNYTGAASFSYTVTDSALTSNSATATLTINPVNDAPVANAITPTAFNEDTNSTITLSYTDTEGDQATACSITGVTNVTVQTACACAAGVCTATVRGTTDYNGAASFTYTVTAASQTSNTATATLSITAVPDAPVAQNITPPAFNEDTASTITLVYTDAEGDFATSCSVTSPTNVTVTTPCSCTLGTCTVGVTGTSNYSGVASFNYTVNANSQNSNSATASLTISAVDDVSVANNINPAAFNEDTQSVITLSYTDIDSQATSCTISSPTNVTVTQACACASGTCTVGVTGTLNYNGAASFSYTVTSGVLTSNVAVANFTINPINDNPVISAITNQNVVMNSSTGAISFTITDVDSTLACTGTRLSMSSSNTTIVPNANVVWAGTAPNCTGTITPAAGQSGTVNITFNVNDGAGGTSGSTFQLIVGSVALQWLNDTSVVITTYSFGSPGVTTTATVFLKNNGNVTSGTITITDNAGHTRLSQTNSCTTLAAGATCAVTLNWDNGGPGGFRQEIYTAAANGVNAALTVSGTK